MSTSGSIKGGGTSTSCMGSTAGNPAGSSEASSAGPTVSTVRCVGSSGVEMDSCCSGACAEGGKAAGEASAASVLLLLLLSGLSVFLGWLVLLLLGVDRSLVLVSLLVVFAVVLGPVLLLGLVLGSGAACWSSSAVKRI